MPVVRFVLLILALIAFALAAAGVPSRLNLVATGLFLWVAAALITAVPH